LGKKKTTAANAWKTQLNYNENMKWAKSRWRKSHTKIKQTGETKEKRPK